MDHTEECPLRWMTIADHQRRKGFGKVIPRSPSALLHSTFAREHHIKRSCNILLSTFAQWTKEMCAFGSFFIVQTQKKKKKKKATMN